MIDTRVTTVKPMETKSSDLSALENRERGLLNGHWPHSEQEAKQAEEVLSEEIARLSLIEHEQAVFDVHGLPQFHNEDPPDVDMYLEQLDNEIHKIPNRHAYELAKYWDEEYVANPTFQLSFLRCDMFDPKVAAQRMVYHFERKRMLFGESEILGRDIRMSDLSLEDIVVLESGFFQVLPHRDTAGRLVLAVSMMLRPLDLALEHAGRAMWYFFFQALSNEEDQRRGVVSLILNMGINARLEPFANLQQLLHVRTGLSKKISSIHYCCDNAALRPCAAYVCMALDKESRKRFRSHTGSYAEIAFELLTYGISIDLIKPDGSMALNWHREWIAARKRQEQCMARIENLILLPRRFDVLFGRGQRTREHVGNLRAVHLVEMHQSQYDNCGKLEKTKIADRIVGIIHESKGRFLRETEGGWVEVEHDIARNKISHFFRHLRSKKLASNVDGDRSIPMKRSISRNRSFEATHEEVQLKPSRHTSRRE